MTKKTKKGKVKYTTTSKYLAIKNWEHYQSESNNMIWIKDYVNKEHDPEFGKLTMFQRGLFEGLCRYRARMNRNITNDLLHIFLALSVNSVDRNNVPTALQLLVNCGLLIPSNEEDKFTEERREEENKSKSKKKSKKELENLNHITRFDVEENDNEYI